MFTDSTEHASELIEQGKSIEAQKILKRLIAKNYHDLSAWLLFVETCPTKEQRINALEICLENNLDSEIVRQELGKLKSLPISKSPVPYSNSVQSLNADIWKKPSKSPLRTAFFMVVSIAIGLLVLIIIFYIDLFFALQFSRQF